MKQKCRELLEPNSFDRLMEAVHEAEKAVQSRTAWRVEGTLREFPKFPAINVWFDYPIHRIDTVGVLCDLDAESERPVWQKATDKRKKQAEKKKEKQSNEFEIAFSNLEFDGGDVAAADLAEALEVSAHTLCTWLGQGNRSKKELKKEFEIFTSEDGKRCVRRVEQT